MQEARAGRYAALADKKLLVSLRSRPGNKKHLPNLLNGMEQPNLASIENQGASKSPSGSR